jgi:RNA polymerase sigma factor (sigma-70 family)
MTQAGFKGLLQGAADGDEQAWRAVVGIVQPYLVRRTTRLLGPESLNNSFNDLLQDVWARAFRKIDSFKGGSDDEQTCKMFCKWMARLLDRVYRNRERGKKTVRRRPPRPLIPLDVGAANGSTVNQKEQPAAHDTSVSKRLREEERQRLVRQALATLELPARQIVEYRLLSDKPMSFREIAEKIGLPEWRVREVFHASLTRLRPHLQSMRE